MHNRRINAGKFQVPLYDAYIEHPRTRKRNILDFRFRPRDDVEHWGDIIIKENVFIPFVYKADAHSGGNRASR